MDSKAIKARLLDAVENQCGLLVDSLERLEIEIKVTTAVIVITLKPFRAEEDDENDVGKIIGRGGRNIDAMRTLLGAFTNRYGYRVHVEVVD